MKNRWLLLSILAACLVITATCKTADPADNEDPPAVEGVFINNIAVNFSETDHTGATFSLDSLKGKVVLLVFSAMWCGPCRSEAGDLMELYNTYKARGLEIVQVIFQDEDSNPADLADIKRWMAQYNLSFPVLTDPDYSTTNTYMVSAIPLNLVIDRDFIIVYRQEGFYENAVIQAIEDSL